MIISILKLIYGISALITMIGMMMAFIYESKKFDDNDDIFKPIINDNDNISSLLFTAIAPLLNTFFAWAFITIFVKKYKKEKFLKHNNNNENLYKLIHERKYIRK